MAFLREFLRKIFKCPKTPNFQTSSFETSNFQTPNFQICKNFKFQISKKFNFIRNFQIYEVMLSCRGCLMIFSENVKTCEGFKSSTILKIPENLNFRKLQMSKKNSKLSLNFQIFQIRLLNFPNKLSKVDLSK